MCFEIIIKNNEIKLKNEIKYNKKNTIKIKKINIQ